MDISLFLAEQLANWSAALSSGSHSLRVPQSQQVVLKNHSGHFHLHSELFLQTGGATEFTLPGESLVLGPGEALLIPPRLPHDERVVATDGSKDPRIEFNNIVIFVHGSVLYAHVAESGLDYSPCIRWPDRRVHEACLRLGAWLEDAASNKEALPVARALVVAALARASAVLGEQSPKIQREPALVLKARNLVQNRLSDPDLSVASIAQSLACSADYLSHVFSTCTGQRLVELINDLRLTRAAELLSSTGLSGKETAWACGFVNQSYFIRLFRDQYGLSPLEYQKSRSVPVT